LIVHFPTGEAVGAIPAWVATAPGGGERCLRFLGRARLCIVSNFVQLDRAVIASGQHELLRTIGGQHFSVNTFASLRKNSLHTVIHDRTFSYRTFVYTHL
jgi:hypothetical protein